MRTNLSNRRILDRLTLDINDALVAVAEKHGIEIKVKQGGKYEADGSLFVCSLECVAPNESGDFLDASAKSFQQCATMFGLKPEDLGKNFTTRQGTYKITGAKPRSPKYPILGKCISTGKTYKFSDRAVASALKLQGGEA